MFAKRAHHRLPRPVGLPPRYLRASATTFDEVKLEAIAPPAGVTVAFDPTPASAATLAFAATLALALARPRACICATRARPAGAWRYDGQHVLPWRRWARRSRRAQPSGDCFP